METQVISAMITVSGALGGAFGGAWIANYFAEKRFEKQLQIDEMKERKRILSEKAEELHILISKWAKYIAGINIARLKYLGKKLDENSFHETVNSMNIEAGVHDRIEALVSLYFPTFEEYLVQARKLLSACYDAEYNAVKGSVTLLEAYKEVEQHSMSLDQLFIQMNKSLVDSIKKLI